MKVLTPPWSQPGGRLFGRVGALSTTRDGGISQAPYNGLNLGMHVGDSDAHVAHNRREVGALLGLERPPLWLNQVHGATVIDSDDWQEGVSADAIISRTPGTPLAVMTADCLPILLASTDGSVVAAVHAGWRGLAAGVIAACVQEMHLPAGLLMAWIGPGIAQAAFEVGDDVRDVFVANDHTATNCFVPNSEQRWQADLKMLALLSLRRLGIRRVTDSGNCTFADEARFFSHRRSAPCGRMASIIWIC